MEGNCSSSGTRTTGQGSRRDRAAYGQARVIRAAAEFAYRCGIVALFCAAFATLIAMIERMA